jgi:hypothetical protein
VTLSWSYPQRLLSRQAFDAIQSARQTFLEVKFAYVLAVSSSSLREYWMAASLAADKPAARNTERPAARPLPAPNKKPAMMVRARAELRVQRQAAGGPVRWSHFLQPLALY